MQKNSINVSGRKVDFFFSEAVEENKPILFIMHGHGFNKEPTKFRNNNWNIVFPVDDFGNEGRGSWFLGDTSGKDFNVRKIGLRERERTDA